MEQRGFDPPEWISRLGATLEAPSPLDEERTAATAIMREHPVIENALTRSQGGSAVSLINGDYRPTLTLCLSRAAWAGA